MGNAIDSLNYGNNTYVFTLPYGECSTAAATAAKTVTLSNFVLETGAQVRIKFTYANSAVRPSLNVNSSGAKPIYWHGAVLVSSQYWQAGAVLDFVYNGTQWDLVSIAKDNNTDTNTTYSVATTSANGLMSSSDKSKLDGIATGANAYSLPTATSSTLGGVKIGDNITVSSGTISLSKSNVTSALGYTPPTTNTTYSFSANNPTLAWGTTSTIGTAGGTTYKVTMPSEPSTSSDSTKMDKANPTGTGYFSLNRSGTGAVGNYSVAAGHTCAATATAAHAEGYYTTASGTYSHSEGNRAMASGTAAHAEGYYTTASGAYSHASGNNTTANGYQYVIGHYNNTTTGSAGTSSGTGTGSAFVIGCGSSSSSVNAFRVTYAGVPYSKSGLLTTGCDYAEYFEWQDGNSNNEDRRGYFVTLDGDKIKIANSEDYILGIISGHPSVIGNGDEDWLGRYVFDDFGSFVYEEYEYEEEEPVEVIDEETGETKIEMKITKKTGTKYKENPDYDPSIPYNQREDRPEWNAVGMLGVLSVRDDGTCEVNGYCKVAEGGIATAADTGYRVIKRVSDNVVKVVFK